MSSDARALPLRDAPVGGPAAGSGRPLPRPRASALARAGHAQWVGAICLLAIVAGSALVVLMAADRPSILSPTTHAGFFPRWMAGPLGGAWPGLTRDTTALRWLFSGAIVAMFLAYLLALRYAATLPARGVIAASEGSSSGFSVVSPRRVSMSEYESFKRLAASSSIGILAYHFIVSV